MTVAEIFLLVAISECIHYSYAHTASSDVYESSQNVEENSSTEGPPQVKLSQDSEFNDKDGNSLLLQPPITCHGLVPKITRGEYYFHDNETYKLKFTTNVQLKMDLYHRSCFQVDIEVDNDREPERTSNVPTSRKRRKKYFKRLKATSLNANSKSDFKKDNFDSAVTDTVRRTANVDKAESKPPTGIKSLFYSVEYAGFSQYYTARSSYVFGIPELHSKCQCDCEGGTKFCDINFDAANPDWQKVKSAQYGCGADWPICVTKFHESQSNAGCSNAARTRQPAKLCCYIGVRPYENRRYRAVSLSVPSQELTLNISIYALITRGSPEWVLFRQYQRTVMPYKGNYLHLNGWDNVADMFVFADAHTVRSSLNRDEYYYFDEAYLNENDQLKNNNDNNNKIKIDRENTNNRSKKYNNSNGNKMAENKSKKHNFILLANPGMINNIQSHVVHKYGWLRAESSENVGSNTQTDWFVKDAEIVIGKLHSPKVINCDAQTYLDGYDIRGDVSVVRGLNGSGTIRKPFIGYSVKDRAGFINNIALIKPKDSTGTEGRQNFVIKVDHSGASAPSIKLDIALRQKMHVISHIHASYVHSFKAQVRLDRHSNRFLNVSLIQAYGHFTLKVYRQRSAREVDVILSLITKLPFSANYTEILPLPGHVASSRYVCIHPVRKPKVKLCTVAEYHSEPVSWYTLRSTFVANRGICPGCNEDLDNDLAQGGPLSPSWFVSILNPGTWFGSGGTEGGLGFLDFLGFIIGVLSYVIMFLVLTCVFRRIIYPLARWSCGPIGRESSKKVVYIEKANGKPAEVL